MESIDELLARDAIKQAKARYLRGVDTGDSQLVKDILAEDCVLDYMHCLTDPATGTDFLPEMNVVVRGRASWTSEGLRSMGIVSVHQTYNHDITLTSGNTASSVCAMTDRLFMPADRPYSVLTGYGYYHETYEQVDGSWWLKTLRISRLRVLAE
jgi:hypothetical protein